MNWLQDVFGVVKPVIGMCHLDALPGDPEYNTENGLEWIIDRAHQNLNALQDGGVDSVMFSNEASLPYLTKVEPVTYVTMARIIGELLGEIHVPFGVDVLWDPIASIDLAVATGASFVREVFSGVYSGDFGLWDVHCGEIIRHQYHIQGQGIKLMFNIVPEAASYLGNRSLSEVARSTIFNAHPDALCVSGLTAGVEISSKMLQTVKEVAEETPVFSNTGVRIENLGDQLSVADGIVVGTALKRDGYIWNEVDGKRVKAFMERARQFRAN